MQEEEKKKGGLAESAHLAPLTEHSDNAAEASHGTKCSPSGELWEFMLACLRARPPIFCQTVEEAYGCRCTFVKLFTCVRPRGVPHSTA